MLISHIQTNETLTFILENIPSEPLRILEIGCGDGDLAKRLGELGHEVSAIDSEVTAVQEAMRLGVNAKVVNFPDYDDEPFDVILFTRSLHHIRPLKPALERAQNLLKTSGLLIVEDFAFNDTSEYAAAWFYRLLKLLDSCNALLLAKDSFGRKLLKGGGDLSLWREHVHEINTAREVSQAISERFEILHTTCAPYLYRYVSTMVQENERNRQIISDVLELEKQTGIDSDQFLIGRRFVARRLGA